MALLKSLQAALNFQGCTNPAFKDPQGIGRIALAGFLLGVTLGLHLAIVLCALFFPTRIWLVSPSAPQPSTHLADPRFGPWHLSLNGRLAVVLMPRGGHPTRLRGVPINRCGRNVAAPMGPLRGVTILLPLLRVLHHGALQARERQL